MSKLENSLQKALREAGAKPRPPANKKVHSYRKNRRIAWVDLKPNRR